MAPFEFLQGRVEMYSSWLEPMTHVDSDRLAM